MKLGKILSKIQTVTFNKNLLINHLSEDDIIKQREYLNSFMEPQDDFERMYLKNHFQMKCLSFPKRFIFNLYSMCMLPFFWMWSLCMSLKKTEKTKKENLYIFLQCYNGKNIYPVDLLNECSSYIELDYFNGLRLKPKDLAYILKFVKKHPFLFWLIFRLSYKVALYRNIIDNYSPKAIISCQELSPTSAPLTTFCERNNVELINIMHGERLFDLGNSFVHFHRFYVWDEHYVNLFRKLRASSETKLIVHAPKVLMIDLEKYRRKDNVSDFTYYISGEYYSEKEIHNLKSLALSLKNLGFTIRFRMHPRCNEIPQFERIIGKDIIEYPQDMTIEESIASTNTVISVFSTVLLQAHTSGRKIMLDDLNYPVKYNKLLNLDFIINSKPHDKLSVFLKHRISE